MKNKDVENLAEDLGAAQQLIETYLSGQDEITKSSSDAVLLEYAAGYVDKCFEYLLCDGP